MGVTIANRISKLHPRSARVLMIQNYKYLLIASVVVGMGASMSANLKQWQSAGTELYSRSMSEVQAASVRYSSILEDALGPNHPEFAWSLKNVGLLYYLQGKYSEAEPFCKRALAIDEKTLDVSQHELATDLNNLAALYYNRGKYKEAEPFCKRVLAIDERTPNADSLEMAADLNNLASIYYEQRKYVEAEPLLKRALVIYEKALDANHLDFVGDKIPMIHRSTKRMYIDAENTYCKLLRATNRKADADRLDARAKTI